MYTYPISSSEPGQRLVDSQVKRLHGANRRARPSTEREEMLSNERIRAEAWCEEQRSLNMQFLSAHARGGTEHRAKPYMRLREVLALIPVSASTVWRWVRVGKLTAIKLGPRITVFSRAEVMDVFFSEAAR